MLRRALLILLLAITARAAAQVNADPFVRDADRHYQQMAYARAAALYRTAAELGAVNEHVTKRLAQCSMKLGDMPEAERWYSVVVKFLNREPADLYNYAQALKGNGRYEEAEMWMDRYLDAMRQEGPVTRSNITGYARKFNMDATRFSVKPVSVNTAFDDLAPAWLGNGQVVFSSSRKETLVIQRKAAWNDQPFLDLYVARVAPNGDLADARPLPGSVNTRYHEGAAVASSDGRTIWFTRNHYWKGRAQRSQRGVSRLGIFKAVEQDGAFSDAERFLYNNPELSIAHPALSPSGRRLYFASDMPGGFGGTDIYYCEFLDGVWGEPVNLGSAINTAQDEAYPFVAADGVLYFASNGHPGLGGFDIFMATKSSDSGFAGAMNLGAPINGARDDFGFIIDALNKQGFFASNRPGGAGGDDIYAFDMLAPLEERYLCSGLVVDQENESPAIGAEVILYDEQGSLAARTETDAKGEYSFAVRKGTTYRLVARMKDRFDGEQHVSTEGIERRQIITRDIQLVPDAGIWLRGTLREKDRAAFIAGAKISVVNMSTFNTEERMSGEGGDFALRILANEEFEVLIEKPGFFSMSVPISTIGMRHGVIDLGTARTLDLEAIEIGRSVAFRHIRWPQSGTQLDPKARAELDLLAERLGVNPGVSIEVAVHCDARGDLAREAELTQRRAEAIATYLVGKGLSKDRVRAKGYGLTRLLNHCAQGVQCSEEEHAVNRRSEYTVISAP
ncbi:MAG: PD40 domain-containing protein [Flavobacteriales bacterium]|nr:PD40 domain-containing protein [Flavobacteriales bacterium]